MGAKKKILFTTRTLRVGGTHAEMVTIANCLARNGYDVTIQMLQPRNEIQKMIDKRVRVLYKPMNLHPGNKIPYIRYKFYDDDMWEKRCTPRQYYRYLIDKEKYDVEIAFYHGYPLKMVSGSTNKKAKKIGWVHFDYEKFRDVCEGFPTKQALVNAYKKMDNIVCVSDAAAYSFRKAIGEFKEVRVIHNLIPIQTILENAEKETDIKLPKAKLKIVTVGRIKDDEKGQERLIDTVVKLRKEGVDITLTIIGAGVDGPRLKEKVKNIGAGSFIIFTNSQFNPYPIMKQADLLVCASYSEGYNLAIAEALILGIPVLSTDCAGPREILDNGKYGMIVENSEEGLYDGLKLLYNSPELLKQYKEKAEQRVGLFEEDDTLIRIIDLIES